MSRNNDRVLKKVITVNAELNGASQTAEHFNNDRYYHKYEVNYWELTPTINSVLFDNITLRDRTCTILHQMRRQNVLLKAWPAALMNKANKKGECNDCESVLMLNTLRWWHNKNNGKLPTLNEISALDTVRNVTQAELPKIPPLRFVEALKSKTPFTNGLFKLFGVLFCQWTRATRLSVSMPDGLNESKLEKTRTENLRL